MKYRLTAALPFIVTIGGALREFRVVEIPGSSTGRLIHLEPGAADNAPCYVIYEAASPAALIAQLTGPGVDPVHPACRGMFEAAVQAGKAERLG